MDKEILVDTKVRQYFYYKELIKRIDLDILDIENQMKGLKSPNLELPPVQTGEDRGSKLIRLGAMLDDKEKLKDDYTTISLSIYNELHLFELDDFDLTLLEYHSKGISYERIADKIGYASKVGAWRKIKSIYHKLTIYVK